MTKKDEKVKKCQAKCRDDTSCLNRIHKEDYCWLHYNLSRPK